jgi:hypothetical protein
MPPKTASKEAKEKVLKGDEGECVSIESDTLADSY